MNQQLAERVQHYADGHIALTDDPEVFRLVMNLPIIRELQNQNSILKSAVQDLGNAFRYLQNSGDAFCIMWENFKEATELHANHTTY